MSSSFIVVFSTVIYECVLHSSTEGTVVMEALNLLFNGKRQIIRKIKR